MGVVLVVLLIVAVSAMLFFSRGGGWGKRAPTGTAELRQRLLRRVMGDQATVDRLVEHERRLRPDASERQLLVAALGRFRQDRR